MLFFVHVSLRFPKSLHLSTEGCLSLANVPLQPPPPSVTLQGCVSRNPSTSAPKAASTSLLCRSNPSAVCHAPGLPRLGLHHWRSELGSTPHATLLRVVAPRCSDLRRSPTVLRYSNELPHIHTPLGTRSNQSHIHTPVVLRDILLL